MAPSDPKSLCEALLPPRSFRAVRNMVLNTEAICVPVDLPSTVPGDQLDGPLAPAGAVADAMLAGL